MRYAELTMIAPYELHAGADVYSSDAEKLGTLHRVVINRRNFRVTHVVVDVGFLRSGHHLWEGGLAREYDRVVPIDAVRKATDERVDLALTAGEFKNAPEYTEEQFEPPQDLTPNKFDITDVTTLAEEISASIPGGTSDIWLVEKLHKTRHEREITEGTPVWRQHPHEKIGEVDRVLIDPETSRAQALVVRSGFLRKHDIIVPVRYISELLDDLVRVELSDAELEQLHEYRPGQS